MPAYPECRFAALYELVPNVTLALTLSCTLSPINVITFDEVLKGQSSHAVTEQKETPPVVFKAFRPPLWMKLLLSHLHFTFSSGEQ